MPESVLKKLLLSLLMIAGPMLCWGQQLDDLLNETDSFLKTYVFDGRVDYGAIARQPASLESLRGKYASFDLSGLSPVERKAFWINAYNVTVIGSVSDRVWISSPQDVPGFFDREKHTIAGEELSINEIENDQIRVPFEDARIHFVLVCAAIGCPKIVNEVYRPQTLDTQLVTQSSAVLNGPDFIRIDTVKKEVAISQIFTWYSEDFKLKYESNRAFINAFRDSPLPADFKITTYEYDWRLNSFPKLIDDNGTESINIQNYTPSQLLKKGQWEVKLFNNLYTDNAQFNALREHIPSSNRQSYFTSFIQTQFGASSKFNMGIDAQIKSVLIHDAAGDSPLQLLSFSGGEQQRTALSYIGPKIKIAPFAKAKGFSLQTTLFIPVAKDQQGVENGAPWLSHDGYQWWTQLFYDQKISEELRAFFEVDAFVSIDRNFSSDNTSLLTPAKAFISYFASPKLTFYGMGEFGPNWGQGGISSFYTQAGLGAKYQIVPGIEFEGLYTNFPVGKNSGAGNTFNIGLRILR